MDTPPAQCRKSIYNRPSVNHLLTDRSIKGLLPTFMKQSNLDCQKISIEIDTAITVLKSEQGLRPQEREKLIEYLREAKDELSKNDVSWRKVIGALVIASTLLGGIAIAPQAAENIGNAINYILGTSLETPDADRLGLWRKGG